MNGIEGIDVSRWQGPINWGPVRQAGIQFVWVKATEGAELVDPLGARHVHGAREAGLVVGVYHFARPGDPVAQARRAVDMANQWGAWGLPLALDLEVEVGNASRFADAFINTVRELSPRKVWPVILYTGFSYLLTHGLGYLKVPLWIARYRERTLGPGLTNWDVWQYTSKGVVPGVAGNVDRNVAREESWPYLTDTLDTLKLETSEGGGNEMKYQLVRWKDSPGVYVTDGVRLIKAVPNPRIRDILVFNLGEVRVIEDREFWDWLRSGS